MPHRATTRPSSFRPTRPRVLAAAALGLTLVLAGSAGAASAAQFAPASVRADSTPPLPGTIDAEAATVESITADAEAALADAYAVRAEAEDLNAEVSASGLSVEGTTSVSVAPLDAAIADVDGLDLMPIVFVPALTSAVNDASAAIADQAADLRTRLNVAVQAEEARRAAEEAAAQAAAEAAAAAAAQAAADAAAVETATATATAVASTGDNSPGAAQAAAQQIMASDYGWGDSEFSCLLSLWDRESGWNYAAYNSSSGATGIPQALPGSKMASAGSDWATNAVTQVRWGLGYIAGSYGSPCNAWAHSESVGWY